jgi:hypothetical protein
VLPLVSVEKGPEVHIWNPGPRVCSRWVQNGCRIQSIYVANPFPIPEAVSVCKLSILGWSYFLIESLLCRDGFVFALLVRELWVMTGSDGQLRC